MAAKKKGPVRIEGLVPFAIVAGVIAAYFIFLFDWNLKKGIEYVGTQVNGAEVDVAGVKTSFWNASFLAEGIEVTDAKSPELNKVAVEKVQFKLLWDALLRGKFVVDLAGVEGIQAAVPRKSPGRVLPPPRPGESQGYLKTAVLEKVREQFDQTELGNLAEVLEGFDPSKELKGLTELASIKRIEALDGQLSSKEKEWTQTLTTLPADQEFSKVQDKIKGIKIGGNPAQAKQGVTDLMSALKDAEGQAQGVQTKVAALQADVDGFQKSVAEVDQLIEQDKKNQEKRLKLPDLDPKTLSSQFFGQSLVSQVKDAEKYKAMADQYISGSKSKAEAEPVRKRLAGRNYHFGKPRGYPSFWLKKGVISSHSTQGPYAGDVSGELLDVSTDQAVTGRAAQLNVRGNFPGRKILGVRLEGRMDRLTPVARDQISASVDAFPVAKRMLTQTDSLRFGVQEATGKSQLRVELSGPQMLVRSHSEFRNARYDVGATSKLLDTVLKNAAAGLPVLEIDAEAKGTWDSPSWSVSSNLGAALARAVTGQLGSRVAEARKKINDMVQAQVGGKKQELQSRFTGAKAKVTGPAEAKKKKAEETKQLAQARLEDAKRQAATSAAPALGNVKKKFGF